MLNRPWTAEEQARLDATPHLGAPIEVLRTSDPGGDPGFDVDLRTLEQQAAAHAGSPDWPLWRTLAGLSDAPPDPLLLGMLEPDGPTLASGVGSQGPCRRMLCVELQRLGMLPLVYDAEQRPRKWARRVSGRGRERHRVVYTEPRDLPSALAGQPLWEAGGCLGNIARAAGADLCRQDHAGQRHG